MSEKVYEFKTVIIGAGISGISAAINFLDNNYNDFIIIEALERIGGRVFTHTTEKGYFEIGAQWIHGQEGNPLYEIARQNNLLAPGFEKILTNPVGPKLEAQNLVQPSSNLLNSLNLKQEKDKVLFVTQKGLKIEHNFAKSVYDTITRIILSAEQLSLDPNSSVDNRVGDYLYDKFVEVVQNELGRNLFDKLEEIDLKRILNGLFLMRARRENIRNGCFNIFDVSLKNFSSYKEFKGHSYVELKHGYGPVLDSFISKHKEKFYSRVRCRHFLKKIYLSQDLVANSDLYKRPNFHSKYTNDRNKAVLVICDATDPNKPQDFIIMCDHVLCTMSLGYLKENFNNIIEPLSLMSAERRNAVNRLGFGTINKIFLIYDEPFWNENLNLVNLIWVPDDLNFRLDKLMHRNDTRKLWFEDVCKFEVVNSYPNALSAWIAGNVEFERLDDKTIALELTKLLRQFLSNPSIPEPKSIIRTKWNMNRYSRGTYSHLPLGSDSNDFDIVAKPIPSNENPIVMFAGEATHKDYFSTVHGAFLTGQREAERVLKLFKNKNSHL